jgi:hypothetical protein
MNVSFGAFVRHDASGARVGSEDLQAPIVVDRAHRLEQPGKPVGFVGCLASDGHNLAR